MEYIIDGVEISRKDGDTRTVIATIPKSEISETGTYDYTVEPGSSDTTYSARAYVNGVYGPYTDVVVKGKSSGMYYATTDGSMIAVMDTANSIFFMSMDGETDGTSVIADGGVAVLYSISSVSGDVYTVAVAEGVTLNITVTADSLTIPGETEEDTTIIPSAASNGLTVKGYPFSDPRDGYYLLSLGEGVENGILHIDSDGKFRLYSNAGWKTAGRYVLGGHNYHSAYDVTYNSNLAELIDEDGNTGASFRTFDDIGIFIQSYNTYYKCQKIDYTPLTHTSVAKSGIYTYANFCDLPASEAAMTINFDDNTVTYTNAGTVAITSISGDTITTDSLNGATFTIEVYAEEIIITATQDWGTYSMGHMIATVS